MYTGHKGWVLCLETFDHLLFSGGDDHKIIVWNIETTRILEVIEGHENGVSSLCFANGDLYSASYDHFIIVWDLEQLFHRLGENEEMR